MIIDEGIEEKGKAEIVMVRSFPFGPDEGAVYVYKVTPAPVPAGMRIEEFFLVSFCDDNTEIAWGIGSSPEEALEYAAKRWAKYSQDDDNPFKQVLDEIISQKGGE